MQGVRLVELGDLYFDVSLLLWCCSLVWLTHLGLCSAYVPMLMVAFPLVTRLLLAKEFKHRGKRLDSFVIIFCRQNKSGRKLGTFLLFALSLYA